MWRSKANGGGHDIFVGGGSHEHHKLFIGRVTVVVVHQAEAQPATRGQLHWNQATLMVEHKKNWESVGLMNKYYVVGITPIPYLGFGVIINIVLSLQRGCRLPCYNW